MKGFLVFFGIVLTFGAILLALPFLDARKEKYEQRFVGALNFAEDRIETALDLHTGIYEPTIQSGEDPDHWVLSGLIVSKDNLGSTARAPFLALMEHVCAESFDLACWRMVALAVDGRPVAAAPAIAAAPEPLPEGLPAQEEILPVPALLSGSGGTMPALPSSQRVTPAKDLTAPVQEAVASVGDTSTLLQDEGMSRQDLIRFVQNALTALRYDPGPVDGKFGSKTATAIRAYQFDHDLAPDGLPSVELWRHMRRQLGNLGQQSHDPTDNDRPPG